MTLEADAAFDRFLEAFYVDLDEGQLRPVEDYLARFSGCESAIREEWVTAKEHAPTAAPPDPRLSPELAVASGRASLPSSVGRYEVEGFLAEGGQGIVYRGRDPELDRPVVIKTLRAALTNHPSALQRLRREARLTGRLDHPGICSVLDVVEEHGAYHVVMPFIEGESLARERIGAIPQLRQDSVGGDSNPDRVGVHSTGGEERADLRPIVRLMEKICRVVHVAHEAGVIHRDLKPGNLIIRPDGSPVVLDFGLALDESSATRLTAAGASMGTPVYMAPEQIEGKLDAFGPATDVYALGVILYELTTGVLPFLGRSKQEIFHRILRGVPMLPRKLNPRMPRDLEGVCLKAIDPDPSRRYESAAAFADDLRNVRTLNPTIARPPTWLGRGLRQIRRRPGVTSIGVLVLVIAVVALYFRDLSKGRGDAIADARTANEIEDKVDSGRALSREERDVLVKHLGLEMAQAEITTDTVDRLRRVVLRNVRSGGDSIVTAILPAGNTSGELVRFVLRLNNNVFGAGLDHYIVEIYEGDNPIATRPCVVASVTDGRAAVTLSLAGLPRGRPLAWRVRLDETHHRDAIERFDLSRDEVGSEKRVFTLVASPAWPEPVSGALPALARAARLIDAGHYSDALARLAELADAKDDAVRTSAAVLAVEARAAIGDEEVVEVLMEQLAAAAAGRTVAMDAIRRALASP